MRAVVFFENTVASENQVHAEQWPQAIASMAFEAVGLEPYALVSGMPSLLPEHAQVNFGSAEAPDVRIVTRMLFEIPDIHTDDLLLVFSGTQVAELTSANQDSLTEAQDNYLRTVTGMFGAVVYQFQAKDPGDITIRTFQPLPDVPESIQHVLTSLVREATVVHPEQVYTPNPELVRAAVAAGAPLPPGVTPEPAIDVE